MALTEIVSGIAEILNDRASENFPVYVALSSQSLFFYGLRKIYGQQICHGMSRDELSFEDLDDDSF